MRFLPIFLLLLLAPAQALAVDTPTAYIRSNIDAVLAILTAPELQGEEVKDERLRRIEGMVDTFFDSEELSKRALGQYWRIFDEGQRQEFQALFLELIKEVYLKKSLTYNNEVVNYNQEILKSETMAEVHTTITSPNLNIPIIYFLIRKDASWKVYDVSVENVSLVKNYRSQFQSILQQKSPKQLITILKDKANE
jgi:phospholipid transport system substrate-binding protein